MACSIGAVFSGLMGASVGGVFGEVSTEEVAEHVRAVVRGLFPKTKRRSAR
jgi:hypothetical protein